MPIGFPSTPADNDPHPSTGAPVWRYSSAAGTWIPVPQDQVVQAVRTDLATTGTVNLDFAELHGTVQSITMTGNITFTASNYASGLSFKLHLDSNGSARTVSWPAFVDYGAALVTALASGEEARVALESRGTTAADVDAVSVVSV